MSSLNQVQLIGNVGQDPDIKVMSSGDKVVNLSVATSESWKDKSTGEKQERTQWHRVVIWNQGIAGVVEKYVKKGDKIFIQGQLETRKWEKDGVDQYTTEVVLRAFGGQLVLLGSKGGAVSEQQQPEPAQVAEVDETDIPF